MLHRLIRANWKLRERKERKKRKKKTAGFEPSTFQFPNSAAVLQLEPKAIAELLSYKNFKRA